jgi:Domain of unknown function (DUF4150)
MGCAVYANGMSIACKVADGKSIAAFPDVCFTPPMTPATPPGVPIPYPNTGMASDTTDGSKTVQIGGQEVMLKNKSTFKTSTGDEAGSAPKKGVVTSKIKGKLNFCAWSMDVKFEGENVPRHLDLMGHNEASDPPNTPPWPYLDGMAPSEGDADEETPLCDCCGGPVHSAAQAAGDEISEEEFYAGSPDGPAWLDLVRNADGGKCAHLAPPAPPTNDPCAKYYRNTAAENRAARQTFSEAGANPLSNPNSLPHVHGQGRLAHRVPLCAGGCPIGRGNLAPVGAHRDCQYLEEISGNIQSECAGR